MLEAICFFRHGDALNYHLVGPRFWLETSWLEMTNDLWGNFQSGLFEALYLLTIGIFGNTLWGQLSSQLLHFLLGQGLAALVLFKFFKARKKEIIGALAGLSILTISKSADFFLYAKNDGALACLGLILALMLFDDSFVSLNGKKRNLFLGILMGVIPAIKMSGLFIVLPLSIYFVLINYHRLSDVFITAITALLVFSPILIRNYYFIGNPFFPGLIELFPGVLTDEMKRYYLYHMSNKLSFSSFIAASKSLFTGKIIFLIFFPILFCRLKDKRLPFFSIFVLSIFILYLLVNGGLVVERFFFICYFLITTMIFVFLSEKNFKNKYYYLLLVLILVDSKVDKSIKRIVNFIPSYFNENSLDIVYKHSPYASIWKGVSSTGKKELVISDLFAQQFYSPDGFRIHQFRGRPDVEFLGKCESSDISKLQKYSYAILAEKNQNPCYEKIRNSGLILNQVGEFILFKLPKEII